MFLLIDRILVAPVYKTDYAKCVLTSLLLCLLGSWSPDFNALQFSSIQFIAGTAGCNSVPAGRLNEMTE